MPVVSLSLSLLICACVCVSECGPPKAFEVITIKVHFLPVIWHWFQSKGCRRVRRYHSTSEQQQPHCLVNLSQLCRRLFPLPVPLSTFVASQIYSHSPIFSMKVLVFLKSTHAAHPSSNRCLRLITLQLFFSLAHHAKCDVLKNLLLLF